MVQPVIVDLRNVYGAKKVNAAGFAYESIGRLMPVELAS